jgi:hypothetical protein
MINRLVLAVSAAAMASIIATPTFAAPRTHAHAAPAVMPTVVTSGDRILGADPDPNIRFELLRDAYPGEY